MTTAATSVSDWAAGELVTLPSGKTANLRDTLPLRAMLRTGKLTLEQLDDLQKASEGNLDNAPAALELLCVICEAMFLKPAVTLDGANGTLCIDDIADEDQDHVLERAFGALGGANAATFRDDPTGDDGDADGADVAVPAKRAARRPAGKPRGAQSRQRASGATRSGTRKGH